MSKIVPKLQSSTLQYHHRERVHTSELSEAKNASSAQKVNTLLHSVNKLSLAINARSMNSAANPKTKNYGIQQKSPYYVMADYSAESFLNESINVHPPRINTR